MAGNKKDAAAKLETGRGKAAIEKDEPPLNSLNNMEEAEDNDDEVEYEEDDEEDEYEEDDDEEDEEEEDEEEQEEEKEEEEKVNDGKDANAVAGVKNEGTETKENTIKEDAKKAEEPISVKKIGEKKDAKKAEEPESEKKSGETSKSKEKRPRDRNRKKNEGNDSGDLAVNGNKPESSNRKKPKRVASMGMVFMCSTKTKTDCFRYKILGLPESKKDQVLKIYRGMRLFLFDVDLRLMYGIFKAAGPGGYNIEPKAFKSEFPSQVRFSVLDDCLPLAEENFKSILKENYYSRNKFEGLLKSDQVKKLCKLFVRGGGRSKTAGRSRGTRPAEPRRTRLDESRRSRREDRHASLVEEKRKRRARDEERRPRSRSPLPREKRRFTDYDREPPVLYEREPLVMYDREPPVSRYHPPPVGSPVRLYTYERPPLDIPPYIHEHVPEPHPYRVINRDLDRDRDPYLAYSREPYSREPPMYRDAVYPVPPEYHHVSREYHHPPAVQAPEYRVPGGPRVPSYRDAEIASDYRSSAMALPEYRSRTHYKY